MSKPQNQQLRCPRSGRFIAKQPESPTVPLTGQPDQISSTTEAHKQFKIEVSGSTAESANSVVETSGATSARSVKIESREPDPVEDLLGAVIPSVENQPSVESVVLQQPNHIVFQEEEESDSSSSFESDEELDEAMARPQLKFEKCKVFLGKPAEDALDWVTRYCDIGQYNRWGVAELRANFQMYLDGAARQWFLCLPNKPVEWEDVAATAGPPATAAIPGLPTRFLSDFQSENYSTRN